MLDVKVNDGGPITQNDYELTKIICCNYHAILEFDAQYRGSGHGGRLCMRLRMRKIGMRRVVGATDLISGLILC